MVRQRFDALKMMAVGIQRLHVPALVPERIIENVFEKRPVFAGYRSFTEHDIFVREIGKQIGESIGTPVPEHLSGRLDDERFLTVIVNTRGPVGPTPTAPDELDRAFLDVFDTLFLHPRAEGHEVITNVRKGPGEIYGSQGEREAISARRRAFVQALERASHHALNAFLFSGFPPFSHALAEAIARSNRPIRVAVLMPLAILRRQVSESARRRGKLFPRAYMIEPNTTVSAEDIARLQRQLRRYEEFGIHVSSQVATEMPRFVGMEVSRVKNWLLGRLFECAKIRHKQGEPIYL